MTYGHDDDIPEPPVLRRLRMMVMVLIVVLILGIVTIAATIVIRLGFGVGEGNGAVAAPEFAIPPGEITAAGQGDGTVLFTLRSGDGSEWLLVYDDESGKELSRSRLQRE